MPEPPHEQQSRNNSGRNGSEAPGLRGIQARPGLETPRNPQAGREVARALVEAAREQGRTLSPEMQEMVRELGYEPLLAGGADNPTNENWNQNTERQEDEAEQEYLPRSLTGVSAEGVGDAVAQRILDGYNRGVTAGIFEHNNTFAVEQLRQTISDLRGRINAVDFPPDQYDPVMNALGNLQRKELGLIMTTEKRTRSPKEERRIDLYNETEKFEEDFVDEIKAERIGELDSLDPERVKRFKEERQRLVTHVIDEIEKAPSVEASRFDPVVMEMALKFKETREMLINEILFKPFEDKTEQGHYELNLYASGNLDELLAMLARRGKDPRHMEDREAYQWYKAMRTTSRNFWEMNRGLWTGNLENFSRIAEEMNYDQFETMQRISGVAEVMRLYDERMLAALARDKRITSANLARVKEEVREAFEKMNKAGLLKSMYYKDRAGEELERREMDKWELERALNVGYVFYNITFRGAEVISMSQIDEKDRQFASFPQENAARIMNPMVLTGERFMIAMERGGLEYMQKVRDHAIALMDRDGRHLGKNRFSQIGGLKVNDLEFESVLGISGIFSGWRMSTAAYENFKVTVNGKETNLWKYFKEEKMKYGENNVSGLEGMIGAIKKDKSLTLHQKQKAIVEVLDPLIGETNGALDIGFGMLLRLGQGNAGLPGGFLGEPEGFLARQELWKRVAEKNPLVLANILTNMVEKGGTGPVPMERAFKPLKTILAENGWLTSKQISSEDPSDENYFLNNEKWKTLRQKLQLKQELTVKKYSSPDFVPLGTDESKLTAEEERIVKAITDSGKGVSQDLADIVFPFMVFLNDEPYENFDWSTTGAQFFKRRLGDIGSYSKAGQAATGLMDNIGGLKPEDVIGKHFKEIERGIEGPNGAGFGFNSVLPFVLGYLEMAKTNSGLNSQGFVKEMKRSLNMPTSRLQHFAGVHAPSMGENQAYQFLHQLRHEGVVDHAFEEKIRKRMGLTLWDLIMEIFRDVIPAVAATMVVKTPSSALSLKAA